MRTIRAKELSKNHVIIDENNTKVRIDSIDQTRRGSIVLWVGDNGTSIRFYEIGRSTR